MGLKIGLVSPYDFNRPGGVQEHIRCLSHHLRAMGHQVWVVAPASSERDGLGDNVVHVSGAVVPVPYSGSVAPITVSPAVYRRVKSLLREHQFDVIHVHEPLMPLLPLAVLRHSTAINVATFHAYRESHAGYQLAKPVLEPFVNRLSGRIAVSPAARDMIAHYFPGDYTIIPNGIEFERFAGPDVEPFARYQDGRPNILFVGRLDERKGFEHLIRAFPRVKAAVPGVRLLVVGGYSKDDKAEYVRFARRNGLHEVRFVGFAPGEDIPRYYRSADVFCAPSTGFESFGIVLLEAMAAGVPIAASDIAGYRAVLTDGREGVQVPPGDEAALAAALIGLLGDAELRARMGAAGRETARHYAWTEVAAQVAEFYDRLLERHRSDADLQAREEHSMRELVHRVSGWFDPRQDKNEE